jgi:branched-chain amino acid transport system ATP-binding protein
MLRASDIHAGYGQIEVLHGVGLEVETGQIVTLIGANGAGKSTLLKTLAGILRATGGQVEFEGDSITNLPSHSLARRGISLVKEGRGILAPMTVEENLQMGGFTQSEDRTSAHINSVYEMFPVLNERRKQIAGTLSGGEQQMLAIGRALMSDPKLLMLDEPSLGLAPLIVSQIFECIENLQADEIGILLVEQNASKALKIADYGYVISSGRITHKGTGSELLSDPSLIDAFLGHNVA